MKSGRVCSQALSCKTESFFENDELGRYSNRGPDWRPLQHSESIHAESKSGSTGEIIAFSGRKQIRGQAALQVFWINWIDRRILGGRETFVTGLISGRNVIGRPL